jgi:ABC-type transporter Mla MlaB component
MLLLELYRLLGLQTEFEETGIQYCITYEVSPPSWEPMSPNVRTRTVESKASRSDAGGLDWRGTLTGTGEPFFGRLLAAAQLGGVVAVDCTYLRRIEFATATALTHLLLKARQANASVEFRNVNPLVLALFDLLGISALASVQLRRQ